MSEGTAQTTLFIGVGNDFRGDDAVGRYVARQLLRERLPLGQVIEASGEGTELMQRWAGYTRVIVVDAAQSGAVPGTVHRFAAHEQRLPSRFFAYSSHAFGVAEAIEMARVLGQLPAQLWVYGIEGASFTAGDGLSEVVQQAATAVVEEVRALWYALPTVE